MKKNEELPLNVLNAIDTARASGAIVDAETIKLMILVDKAQLTDDEAIEIIKIDEGLS